MQVSPVKQKINIGNDLLAVKKDHYPNAEFEQQNHMKQLLALRGRMSPKELALVPQVEHMVKQQRQKQLRENLELTRSRPQVGHQEYTKNYGGGLINMSNTGYSSKGYHN